MTTKTGNPALTVVRPTPGFEPGHPRYGGKRNATQQVKALCVEMGVDPMKLMLTLIRDGCISQLVTKEGAKKRVEISANLEMRVDLMKYVSRFIYPTLTATAITGPSGDGPVEILSLSAIMANPETAKLAQQLALKMAAASATPRPALLAPASPEATRDGIADLAKLDEGGAR
ncbi:MAG: hypothetical protein WCB12_22570 [Bryobacteraceae bacterium]